LDHTIVPANASLLDQFFAEIFGLTVNPGRTRATRREPDPHVVVSLIAIVSGMSVLVSMLGAQELCGWTALFLAVTVVTSVTGFFPRDHMLPSHVVTVISLRVLTVASVVSLLCTPSRGFLAAGLRSRRGAGPPPECVRRGRPGVREAAVPEAADAALARSGGTGRRWRGRCDPGHLHGGDPLP
jgi:hypothetical protein